MSTRAYLPLTITGLAEADAAGEVVLTDDVVVAPDDSEEQEYAALMTAADGSAELVGAGRRVVLVVDLPGDRDPQVGERVPRARWAAVHADAEDRPADADPDDDLGWFGVQEIPHLV